MPARRRRSLGQGRRGNSKPPPDGSNPFTARATSKPCLAPDVRLALESRGHVEKRFETTHRRQGATWQRIRHRSRRTPKIGVRHDGRRHQWSPRTENSVSDAADSHLRRGGEDADRSYCLMAIREPVASNALACTPCPPLASRWGPSERQRLQKRASR